jgi:uncharacterized membrane protein YczE
MGNHQKSAVNVVVKNLVVVCQAAPTNDKPASGGKLKIKLVGLLLTFVPVLVSKVQEWMSNFDIS